MLRKLGIGFAVLIAGLFVVIALQPAEFRVMRRATIAAPAAVVFAILSDFHTWGSWSPWEKLDPGMRKTFSGAPRGRGAVYEWDGNNQVGKGRMEITDVRENAQVTIALTFITPFEANNLTNFIITERPQGGVDVVWEMTGRNDFLGKAFELFMDIDQLVGKDFERGLADLGRQAQTQAEKGPSNK